MMRRLFKAGTSGIVIGLVMSLVMNWLFQPKIYTPVNPYATASLWYAKHLNDLQVMTLCACYWFLIGAMFELANWFFEREWSLLKMTVLHYLTMLTGFMPLAGLAGWFSISAINYIVFTLIFSIIYFMIYVISLRRLRKEIAMIRLK